MTTRSRNGGPLTPAGHITDEHNPSSPRVSGANLRSTAASWAVAWLRSPIQESDGSGDNNATSEAEVWGSLTQKSMRAWMDENPF